MKKIKTMWTTEDVLGKAWDAVTAEDVEAMTNAVTEAKKKLFLFQHELSHTKELMLRKKLMEWGLAAATVRAGEWDAGLTNKERVEVVAHLIKLGVLGIPARIMYEGLQESKHEKD